ncbi:alcohol dehydrogenase catalytic domain-containing protein [Acidisoma silvae]|uniref:Alcohol dehydrogenase catalytic domain-containing protein n=1 Tax=Acidisoma silvae TaxID=2802396 RepID=A0A964E0V7_9PROT|nr:alcohol dehydrogenase catalytic domain-containing protein [Acidisoma silvae]MCB8877143.1 alcohol dehydrogenase catalytic domain-containing protein [Acidisoma silvae]
MRAVRFYSHHDIRVEDVAAPSDDPAPGQVLVAPIVCGICGTDLHEYIAGPIVTPKEPNALTGATLPQILGHEFSARIVKTGDGVSHVKPGDLVSIQPLMAPADDYYARRGLLHLSEKLGVIGLSHAWGGMAEQAMLPAANVIPVPAGLTPVQAALIEPAAVAVYAVDRGRVQAGSSVLVSGAGPIGALTLLAARAAGAATLFVSEPNPNRLRKAQEIVPGVIPIDPRSQNLVEIVRAHTESGVGVDTALECVGHEGSLNACVEAVRRQGVVVQAGLHVRAASVNPMLWALKDISIEATWCYPVHVWPRIASMISAGLFPVERIVTAEIDAASVVAGGFEALLDPAGQHLKILVAA